RRRIRRSRAGRRGRARGSKRDADPQLPPPPRRGQVVRAAGHRLPAAAVAAQSAALGTGGFAMEKRFEGKVAFVTGAATGMGQAMAVRLASEGALVGVNHLPEVDPSETLGRIKDA